MAQPHVIVLGGFGATTLVQQNKLFPNRRIWVNRQELALYALDNLDLAPDGFSPGPLAGNPCLPVGPVQEGGYGPLFEQLLADNWDVTFWPYDWRKSLNDQAAEFVRYLNLLPSGNQNFWVIAHSLGGLVARISCPLFNQTGNILNWERTVYLGVPHGGSYYAASTLAGWNPPLSWGVLLALYAGATIRNLLNVFGTNSPLQDRVYQVIAHMRMLYGLLPNTNPPYDEIDPLASGLYTLSNYTPLNPHVTQAGIDDGTAVTKALATQLAGWRPPEVNVIGTGTTTPIAIGVGYALADDSGYTWSTDGDGTVPVNRAALPGANTLTLTADHFGVMNGSQILPQITNLLFNGLSVPTVDPVPPPAPVALPTGPKLYIAPPPTYPPWKQIALDP